ncbi:aminopeptidase [Oceanithermus sp.]
MHPDTLSDYARLALTVGLNLQEGQPLLINASTDALALVRELVACAYDLGASSVIPVLHDPQSARIEMDHLREEYLDDVPPWFIEARVNAIKDGAAIISLADEDPNLLRGVEPDRLRRRQLAQMRQRQHYLELVGSHAVNWLIIGAASPGWARAVFPELDEKSAVEKLWSAIFNTVRLDLPDPEAAWKNHLERLQNRARALNEARLKTLHFKGPGTDLYVGLAKRHLWKSAVARAANGVRFVPNLPTEEVFTAPDPNRVEGVVRSTRPLNLSGTLIDGITARFEEGRVVEVSAESGREALEGLLASDAGAVRLGEVALVETPNPVYDAGFLFQNTLYDENASSHIAFGRAYPDTLGISEGSDAALAAAGGNVSMVHVDWMIGSPEVDVDGLNAAGERIPLMRAGRWVENAK